MKNFGLLIGAGSVGKKHAKNMVNIFDHLTIVDNNKSALEWCSENLTSNISVFESLDLALNSIEKSEDTLCTISNWGIDHDTSFFQSFEAGIKKFYIEKPFANSLTKIKKIKDIVKKNNLNVASGFHHRHSNLLKKIDYISNTYLGGPPSLINVYGGANCIVTNGIHFLDLACSIFNSYPISVFSNLNEDKINPRSKRLGFWDGIATWSFLERKFINIAFTNFSSVRLLCDIICPKGKINISIDGVMNFYVRDDEEIKNDPRIIRTGDVFKSEIINDWEPSQFIENTKEIIKSVASDKIEYDIHRETVATECLIGALISNEKNCLIELPYNCNDYLTEKEWPIS